MNQRQRLGHQGEELAAHYLRSLGYRILEQRYRTAQGEIDIIASRQSTLAFIEVKTRSSTAYGWPAEAVTYQKQRKIRQVALAFMQEGNHKYKDIRFDVISILIDLHGQPQIEYIENAF